MGEIIHKPHLGIFDRNLCILDSQEINSEFSPYLEDLCNFASNSIVRCQISLTDSEGTPVSLIYLYYHVLQVVDGIQVLCTRACFTAAISLLRSLLEAILSIEYIIEDDFESRSAAWLVSHYIERLHYYESFQSSEGATSEFEHLRMKDKFHKNTEFTVPDTETLAEIIKKYRDILTKPKFADVATQFKTGKKNKKWYSLNKGPINLEQLAGRLNRPLEYKELYRKYSAISHAQDASRMMESDENEIYFVQIRSPKPADEVLSLTSALFLFATKLFFEKLRPEEDIAKLLTKIILTHRKRHKN